MRISGTHQLIAAVHPATELQIIKYQMKLNVKNIKIKIGLKKSILQAKNRH
jgi:hypothetical protein